MQVVRTFLPYVLAGIAGGAAALGGAALLRPDAPEREVSHAVPAVNVSPRRIAASPNDFVAASAAAMPVVVHIKAAESEQQARKRYQEERMRNPWGFMEEDFFYGFPGYRQQLQRQESSGSGVIYSANGHIVTNNHVVDGSDEIEVTLYDRRKFRAKVVGVDPKTDVAVLQIEAEGLPVLPLADSDEAQVGEWVLAVGNPFDLTSTVTAGIISAKGRNIDIIKTRDAIEAFIQTDAAVNPGNSGGALVDAQGRLLGINTAIATRTGYYTGYSFAIPSNLLKRIVDDLIDHGSYQRGKMGLKVVELDGEVSKLLGISITQGLVVEYLEPGGAAELAGLQPMDVIVEANGKPVATISEMQERSGVVRPGDILKLNIYRKGKYQRIDLRMR